MALVLSEGEINGVSSIFVNDNQVTLSGALTNGTQRTVASSDVIFMMKIKFNYSTSSFWNR